MHLAIRADGGRGIGFGHLVRTGALAERFLVDGHRVTYITATEEAAREVSPSGVETLGILDATARSEVRGCIERHDPDAVLVDSYEIDEECQRLIKEVTGTLIVVMDDDRFRVHADCLINGNVYAEELTYTWSGAEPVWCIGTEYLMLRSDISRLAAGEPEFFHPPKRALVTMGGSDVEGCTPDVLGAFDGVDIAVDVIVGPGFDNLDGIRSAAERAEGDISLLETPKDIANRMFRADLAVSAAGSTVYELLALGTPTIAIPQAEHQVPIAEALADRDAVNHLPADGLEALPGAIRRLVKDEERRRLLARNGRDLVDGRGTERVYRTISELLD